MSRTCVVTKKSTTTGNKVSHSNRKTRRKFIPNVHNHRFWVKSQNRFVTLKVSHKGLRTIHKKGIEAVLADLEKEEIKG